MNRWMTYADILDEFGRVKRWVQVRVARGDIRQEYRVTGGRRRAVFSRRDVEREHARSHTRHEIDAAAPDTLDDVAVGDEWITSHEALARTGLSRGWLLHRERLGRVRTQMVMRGGREVIGYHAGDVMREAGGRDARAERVVVPISEAPGRTRARDSNAVKGKWVVPLEEPAATQDDVERLPIGAAVNVWLSPPLSRQNVRTAPRRGRIVEHVPGKRFALVEFPAGYRECCFLDQMQVVKGRVMRRAG